MVDFRKWNETYASSYHEPHDHIFDKQTIVIYVLQANTIDEEVMEKSQGKRHLISV